ncbi:hypothetical protein UT300005_05900 [Clostridium sp. CTA-5]
MKLNEIIAYSDFKNLTKEDIDKIVKKLEINDIDDDKKHYLYEIKQLIYRDQELNELIENRVFAGRTSLKWYKLLIEDSQIMEIVEKLESNENYYNAIDKVNTNELSDMHKYTCMKLGNNKYIIRLYVPTGQKTVDNGLELKRIKTISNTTVIIDLNEKLLEVRSSSKYADKIANSICDYLHIINHDGKRILGNHSNSLEKFRDSLNNGKFIDTTSIPDENIELTSSENQLVVKTLESLDEYFIDKGLDKLINSLNDMNPEGTPFTQLLLAGMSKIGMAVKPNADDDLSQKSLYKLFKGYMTDYSGYITFTLPGDIHEIRYTLLVGVKTNTISFRSSVTEEVIDYVKSKIV